MGAIKILLWMFPYVFPLPDGYSDAYVKTVFSSGIHRRTMMRTRDLDYHGLALYRTTNNVSGPVTVTGPGLDTGLKPVASS